MYKNIIKFILLLLAIILGILTYDNIEIKIKKIPTVNAQKIEISGDADRVEKTENKYTGEVIGYYNYGENKFAVKSISELQNKIWTNIGANFNEKLILRTLITLECGRDDGLCIGKNHADAGPFQINQTHDTIIIKGKRILNPTCLTNYKTDFEQCPHRHSEYLVETKQIERLLEFQSYWTLVRIRHFRQIKCQSDKLYKEMNCQGILHNGSKRKYYYGQKSSLSISILYDYYITK